MHSCEVKGMYLYNIDFVSVCWTGLNYPQVLNALYRDEFDCFIRLRSSINGGEGDACSWTPLYNKEFTELTELLSYSLVDSALGPGPSGLSSQFKQILGFSQHPHQFWIPPLTEGGLTIEFPSLWGMRVQAESLLMMHPGKLSQRPSSPIPASLQAAVLSWRPEEDSYLLHLDLIDSQLTLTLTLTLRKQAF